MVVWIRDNLGISVFKDVEDLTIVGNTGKIHLFYNDNTGIEVSGKLERVAILNESEV